MNVFVDSSNCTNEPAFTLYNSFIVDDRNIDPQDCTNIFNSLPTYFLSKIIALFILSNVARYLCTDDSFVTFIVYALYTTFSPTLKYSGYVTVIYTPSLVEYIFISFLLYNEYTSLYSSVSTNTSLTCIVIIYGSPKLILEFITDTLIKFS